MMKRIAYIGGYKYQLAKSYMCQVPIRVSLFINTPFIQLDLDGTLIIKAGYAWDGASGPAIDTKNFMRPSLVHDALYQLLRERHLGYFYRQVADQLLYDQCREDGMTKLRAWYVYKAVRTFGGPSAIKGRTLIYAPK